MNWLRIIGLGIGLSSSVLGYGQDLPNERYKDLGVVFSTDQLNKFGLEFRNPFGESYRYKIGFTVGGRGNYFPRESVYSASDTTVIMTRQTSRRNQFNLRLGLERDLKFGFSLGLDLNLAYRSQFLQRQNIGYAINENGTWEYAEIVSPENYDYFTDQGHVHQQVIGEHDFAQVNYHFLNTDLRLSLNLDVPISNHLMVHASLAGIFGTPIYLNESDRNDPKNYYPETPPNIFNGSVMCNVGVRYALGKNVSLK